MSSAASQARYVSRYVRPSSSCRLGAVSRGDARRGKGLATPGVAVRARSSGEACLAHRVSPPRGAGWVRKNACRRSGAEWRSGRRGGGPDAGPAILPGSRFHPCPDSVR